METGDGLIARVRAPRGRLSLAQAAAVAKSAIACGNGAIGLSALGNLHLRGLSERTLADLHARLSDARLIDGDPEIERLSNIVVSPLDDLDPEALLDLSPSAAALETRLAENEDLRRLPARCNDWRSESAVRAPHITPCFASRCWGPLPDNWVSRVSWCQPTRSKRPR